MTQLEAVQSFCEKVYVVPHDLTRPWVSGGKVVATNGHALIMVPKEILPGHFAPWHSSTHRPEPDLGRVYSLTDALPEPVSASAFIEAIAQVDAQEPKPLLYRTVPPTEPCYECEGKGRGIDIDDGLAINCPTCDGTGAITNHNAGEVDNLLYAVPCLGMHINYHYIKIIVAAMEAFGGEWVRRQSFIKHFGLPPVVLENSHGVQIAVMPMRPPLTN